MKTGDEVTEKEKRTWLKRRRKHKQKSSFDSRLLLCRFPLFV